MHILSQVPEKVFKTVFVVRRQKKKILETGIELGSLGY